MPVSTMILLAGVVAMFAVFAGALAWAEAQTRNLTTGPAPADFTDPPKRRSL
ncbi:hypothetical protein [Bradyrhizobium sp. NP1]|uniref:hypothetical protein n=1 Tax=Bradyrhizobium sp. NP1 TaxID=3049772 RepID=UPI0025A5A52B|nr:hypothetical protein [Bradyrhizobium sp. NP1]WJR80186.1 hypothetical protein QOU61_10635 [Bradyrhizobium sp. NP1]